MRTRAKFETIGGHDVCRIDVARSSIPIRAQMSEKTDVFWVRMNNTTRAWPDAEIAQYVQDRWAGL